MPPTPEPSAATFGPTNTPRPSIAPTKSGGSAAPSRGAFAHNGAHCADLRPRPFPEASPGPLPRHK